MSIFVVGMNHNTASITLREKMYFPLDKLSLYLQDLLSQSNTLEAVLLSTCNRSELYCETNDVEQIKNWFYAQTSLSRSEVEPSMYIYRDEEAVAHIMRVACGLDSMILGEPQILGQMKEAFSESCSAGTVQALFHQLFQQVFAIAKEIRTTTAIGACPVSVASAAVHFAKQQTTSFEQAKIVLIGAGDTTELLLRYLKHHTTQPIMIVNRSIEKAEDLVKEYGGSAHGFDQLSTVLAQADIVISATGSAVPIVSQAVVADAIQKQKRRTSDLMLVDIAVPRDIDPAVAELKGVQLFCIDDLKVIIEKNRQGREHAAEKAREVIRDKSRRFILQMNSLDKVSRTIRAYRSQIETICQSELLKAQYELRQGADPVQVLETFAHAFTQKLLHTPSVKIRQAGVDGHLEFLRFAKQLFAITDPEIEQL
jgi:glutamyl-tRNA reductase